MRSVEEIEKDWLELCASGRRRKDVITGGEKFGTIIKEEFIVEDAGKMGDYVKLIQRIEDVSGKNPWVRFTYYVKRPGWRSWKLAGQTSLMLALEDARKLLSKAEGSSIL